MGKSTYLCSLQNSDIIAFVSRLFLICHVFVVGDVPKLFVLVFEVQHEEE